MIYGLSVEEILMADDKELNKWSSLKKALEYKPDHIEKNEVKTYRQKASNDTLKRKILKSLYSIDLEKETENHADIAQNSEQQNAKKKRKRRKKTKMNEDTKLNGIVNDLQSETKVEESLPVTINLKEAHGKKVKVNEDKKEPETLESNAKKRKLEDTVENSSAIDTKKSKKKKKNNETMKIPSEHPVSTDKVENPSSSALSKESTTSKKDKVKNNKQSKSENKTGLSKKELRKKLFLSKKLQKIKGKTTETDPISQLSMERLKAYGVNPKKFKNKLKYKNKK